MGYWVWVTFISESLIVATKLYNSWYIANYSLFADVIYFLKTYSFTYQVSSIVTYVNVQIIDGWGQQWARLPTGGNPVKYCRGKVNAWRSSFPSNHWGIWKLKLFVQNNDAFIVRFEDLISRLENYQLHNRKSEVCYIFTWFLVI